jgi:signal peptidase I
MPINRSEAFVDLSAELLSRGHRVRFRPNGNSMLPTIKDGEAVTVAPVKHSAIKRGDILLYLTRRGVTAHRVVKINKSKKEALGFILRGDAPGSSDESVRFDQVLGKVISVERDGRNIDLTSRRAKIMRATREGASKIKSRIAH